MDLRANRGAQVKCSKCGADDLLVRYHKPGCADPNCRCATCNYNDHARRHDEHLHVYCRGCGYDWEQDVLASGEGSK